VLGQAFDRWSATQTKLTQNRWPETISSNWANPDWSQLPVANGLHIDMYLSISSILIIFLIWMAEETVDNAIKWHGLMPKNGCITPGLMLEGWHKYSFLFNIFEFLRFSRL
jgi:hypothetical protein